MNATQQKFSVGDCVILNDCEKPCGEMVAVVIHVNEFDRGYLCKYLNADPKFDDFNRPGMQNTLSEATKIEDFGVVILRNNLDGDGRRYFCEQRRPSAAKYRDGKPREWQEWFGPFLWKPRNDVATLVWPEGIDAPAAAPQPANG